MRPFLAVLVLIAGAMPASAQWLDRSWPGIPRTADGKPNLSAPAPRGPDKKPDLSGVWDARPVVARPDPANLQSWVLDRARQHQEEYYKGRPMYQCRPSGPEAERYGTWKRILQTPAAIAILNDDVTYRVIHMDGRQLESNAAPSWMGYSVGRWDGDTLVVESNGFNDKTWASRYGVSHTEALRTTERYRRVDFGHLHIDVTFTDPGAFAKPWSFTVDMDLAADTEIVEQVCEHSSDEWTGTLSDAANTGVSVPADVLAKYVGVYSGIYGGKTRAYEVSLSGGQLTAKIVGEPIEGGLGAVGLDVDAARPLVPLSQTKFEGLGLGYEFIVDDKGVVTDLVATHISGPYKFSRQR
jgi:hypothetical protein